MKKSERLTGLFLALVLLIWPAFFACCGGKTTETPAGSTAETPVTKPSEAQSTEKEASSVETPSVQVPETEVPSTETPSTGTPETDVQETPGQTDLTKEYLYEGVAMTLPADFCETAVGNTTMLVSPTYPSDADNITLTSIAGTSAGFTSDALKQVYEQFFGTINDYRFEMKTIDGGEMALVSYGVTVNGVKMKQSVNVLFFDGKAVTVTFTDVSGVYTDVLDQIRQSLHVKK